MRHNLSRIVGGLVATGLLMTLAGCAAKKSALGTNSLSPAVPRDNSPSRISSKALFEDVTDRVGLTFKHDLGDNGRFYIVENTAPGCAFFDYDNDGYLDIFLVQSGSSGTLDPGSARPNCGFYRNNRNGTFSDVAKDSGFDKDLGYGQGVAVADYDNDGYDDVFVSAYGGNHLFHNLKGSGHFEDVTRAMGMDKVHGSGYATSAAFGDYDNDGRLDLYICYYMKWSPAINKDCRDEKTQLLDYCAPKIYDPVIHQLWHNDGTHFTDESQKSGIAGSTGHGLSVAFLDYNQDGRQDIFVANDLTPNMLWRNNGNGTFTDVAVEAGCAYGEEGKIMAAMGIGIADYDHSGRESLYVSNFSSRPNILFRNAGGGLYEDATEQAQLAFSHRNYLTFGCEFIDYDADGWSDLITNNGHVQMQADNRPSDVPYAQRKQLLHNDKGQRFSEITDTALLGELSMPTVGRGLAIGDYDNDGRIDFLAANQNASPQLFHNRMATTNHWVSLHLVGTQSNRDGIGARVKIKAAGAWQSASVRGGSSYLSSSDRRLYFGLGKSQKIDELTIIWPSGTRETLKTLSSDKFYTLTEGKGVTGQQMPQTSLTPRQ